MFFRDSWFQKGRDAFTRVPQLGRRTGLTKPRQSSVRVRIRDPSSPLPEVQACQDQGVGQPEQNEVDSAHPIPSTPSTKTVGAGFATKLEATVAVQLPIDLERVHFVLLFGLPDACIRFADTPASRATLLSPREAGPARREGETARPRPGASSAHTRLPSHHLPPLKSKRPRNSMAA